MATYSNPSPLVEQDANVSLTMPQPALRQGRTPVDISQNGRKMYTGHMTEPYAPPVLRNLHGKTKTYRRMEFDPTVGGVLQAYNNIMSIVKLDIEAACETDLGETYKEETAVEYQQFVKSCFDDMGGQGLSDVVASALEMLVFGFNVQVPQFKLRRGWRNDKDSSNRDDGLVGWRCFKTIDPETIHQWLVPDGEGYTSLTGVRQLQVRGGFVNIPRNRLLVFRTTAKGDCIEGESILQSAYQPWDELQRIKRTEEVALERNLEGIPVGYLPGSHLSNSATEDEKKILTYMTSIVKHLKFNEQTGLILPSDVDENGNKLVDIKLLSSEGTGRVAECRAAIEARELLIAETLLAGFIKLGAGGSGSYALSNDMTDILILCLNHYMKQICNVICREAIPTLLRLNGMDVTHAPKLAYSGLDKDNAAPFVDAIVKSIQAGAVAPTKKIQEAILKKLEVTTEGSEAAWDEMTEIQEKLQEQQDEAHEVSIKSQQASMEQNNQPKQDNNNG